MVMVSSALLPISGSNIDLSEWLLSLEAQYSTEEINKIRHAYNIVQNDFDDAKTSLNLSCISQGLEIANLLRTLKFDAETLVAAILYPVIQSAELSLDDIKEQFPINIYNLLNAVLKMDSLDLVDSDSSTGKQIDNYRRMLLAMVDDIRVVVIKLAERTVFIRHIAKLSKQAQQHIAQKAKDIFAPLANRLGIIELKWELEDLSFHFLEKDKYTAIAKNLNERRLERENFVNQFINTIKTMLAKDNVNADIKGRAKHIYSIYRKMERKDVGYEEIYDNLAMRIVAENITDCYTALSIIHSQWEYVPHEFDDYIATPKPNGYQSIHTVVNVDGRNIEVQIRTQKMHEDNEMGTAAHWMYKEGGTETNYQQKIHWLRQLLDWQREVADSSEVPDEIAQGLIEQRVYVFTPDESVISLPLGSTPLDFAYHIHTSVGHRCRGAKVNQKMVPLTYKLQLGDRVDILTSKNESPSRDWLNPHSAYLISARSKTKIHAWFKKRDYSQNHTEGQNIFLRELKKLGLGKVDPTTLTSRFHLNTGDDVLAAIGSGDIRLPQLLGALQELVHDDAIEQTEPSIKITPKKITQNAKGILVEGVDNLLTTIAHCCKPLPGDHIEGFITKGRGISIHRYNCANFGEVKRSQPEKIVEVNWGTVDKQNYVVDLLIEANKDTHLLREITRVISENNIQILGLNSHHDDTNDLSIISVSLEIKTQEELKKVTSQLNNLTNITQIRRQ